MFDRKDMENIGKEYENGLKASNHEFSVDQIRSMRIGFEMGSNAALHMIESRVELKETFKMK